ncbi:MAG: hypothetical protein H7833_02810 [Magnetococcus sp. DMHC-1]|nr:hypothetical protein [Magnetococcales bacterium]
MLTITVQCEVPVERTITVKLPDQIEPGIHDVVLVFDQSASHRKIPDDAQNLMKLSGTVPSFARIDGVAWQRSLREEWK